MKIISEMKQLRDYLDLYRRTKQAILFAEEIDPEFRINIQAIKELRDAHDHFMRAIARLEEDGALDNIANANHETIKYCEMQFTKAYGHTYRALFDALDGTLSHQRLILADSISRYSHEALSEVFPDYPQMRQAIIKANAEIAEYRLKKDVGEGCSKVVDEYFILANKMQDYIVSILGAAEELEQAQNRHEDVLKEKAGDRRTVYIAATISGLMSALVAVGWKLFFE